MQPWKGQPALVSTKRGHTTKQHSCQNACMVCVVCGCVVCVVCVVCVCVGGREGGGGMWVCWGVCVVCVVACVVCGGVWCVCVCVVCVVQMIKTRGSLSCQAPEMQLIRVAEHLGASSRRPRHPLLHPDGGGSPWAVYLCTRPKKAFPSHHEKQLRMTSAVFCTSQRNRE